MKPYIGLVTDDHAELIYHENFFQQAMIAPAGPGQKGGP